MQRIRPPLYPPAIVLLEKYRRILTRNFIILTMILIITLAITLHSAKTFYDSFNAHTDNILLEIYNNHFTLLVSSLLLSVMTYQQLPDTIVKMYITIQYLDIILEEF